MNTDQLGGLVRSAIPFVSTYLAHYALNSDTWTALIGALGMGFSALWSYQTNKSGTLIK
jgi:hypothetical protein